MRKISRILRHLFIPHRGNAFRPHALRHRALSLYAIILIISQFFFGLTFLASPATTSANSDQIKNNVIVRTNIERRKTGASNLTENPQLTKAAQEKINDMFSKNYWDHTGPSGETAWQFIESSGYRYILAGENLAKGFTESEEVVSAWMASPTHRENMLNSRFSEIGLAVGSGDINGNPTTLIVQLFGQPRTALVEENEGNGGLVMGSAKLMPEISLSNASVPSKLPYVAAWTLLFALVVIDGVMIRRLGLHGSKVHLANFRTSLILIIAGLSTLMIGAVGIA